MSFTLIHVHKLYLPLLLIYYLYQLHDCNEREYKKACTKMRWTTSPTLWKINLSCLSQYNASFIIMVFLFCTFGIYFTNHYDNHRENMICISSTSLLQPKAKYITNNNYHNLREKYILLITIYHTLGKSEIYITNHTISNLIKIHQPWSVRT